jgi:A/G-specific adenine glycosylase
VDGRVRTFLSSCYQSNATSRFPTVKDLASSNIEAVNALWKGLGYYSRAARLYEGAKIVVKKFQGRLPDDSAVLQDQVPGIGRYSAGNIISRTIIWLRTDDS